MYRNKNFSIYKYLLSNLINNNNKIFKSFAIFTILFSLSISIFPLQKNNQYSFFFTQAEDYRINGDFKKAIQSFEKTLNLAKKQNNREKELESFIKLGLMYWNIGFISCGAEYKEKKRILSEFS